MHPLRGECEKEPAVSNIDSRKQNGEPRWLGPASPTRIALIPPISAARWLLLLVVLAGIYFFNGFLVPVLAALVIGFASWPVYTRLLRQVGGNTTLGATIAIILIIAFLVVPIFIAASYTATEIREWFGWAVHVNKAGAPVPDWIAALPGIGPWLGEQWVKYIGTPGAIGEVINSSAVPISAISTGRSSPPATAPSTSC